MVQDKSSSKKKATTKVTGQNSLGKGVTCFGCAGQAHVYLYRPLDNSLTGCFTVTAPGSHVTDGLHQRVLNDLWKTRQAFV